ncbi:VapC toxin family PIN domain ribonuclease [Streptomyces venezuelae]|uniref:Ribonuclease VapC n=1 Tax=Streptomyces venezuelae TaxID=54571 RepID=A0A5P2D324_STRVZ|nr:PIN domain nuclease [Streptomyces venezuelae]QES49562.1 VapC toxin family PIN domain ribonuclease [Streptomyces venezuelae]
MTDLFLIDRSALARSHLPSVAAVLAPLHERGLLAICPAVEYELMFSIRSKAEVPALAQWLRGFDYLYCDRNVSERALEVQRKAIGQGFHRALSWPDLLIAATAEQHGSILLHHDRDFDMIASITGQRTEWVVPPGSAD